VYVLQTETAMQEGKGVAVEAMEDVIAEKKRKDEAK